MDLIKKELEAVGIVDMTMSAFTANTTDDQLEVIEPLGSSSMEPLLTCGNYQPQHSTVMQGDHAFLDGLHLDSEGDKSMGFNLLDMSTEMYETFSQIEPLSVTMDPGFDF